MYKAKCITNKPAPAEIRGSVLRWRLAARRMRRLCPRLQTVQSRQGRPVHAPLGAHGRRGRGEPLADGLRLEGEHQPIRRLSLRLTLLGGLTSEMGGE